MSDGCYKDQLYANIRPGPAPFAGNVFFGIALLRGGCI